MEDQHVQIETKRWVLVQIINRTTWHRFLLNGSQLLEVAY